MKTKSTLSIVLTLVALVAASIGAYTLARFPKSSPSEPLPTFTKLYDRATPIPLPTSESKLQERCLDVFIPSPSARI
jgi:hypothetical protein